MSTSRRFLRFLAPYWHHVVLLVACVAIVTAATLIVPQRLGELFNVIERHSESAERGAASAGVLRDLNLAALAVIAIYLAKGLFTYGQTYLTYFLGQRVAVDLRDTLFRHVQRLSLSFHERRKSGEVVSRFTNDVSLVQNSLINGAADLVSQAAILVGAVLMLL